LHQINCTALATTPAHTYIHTHTRTTHTTQICTRTRTYTHKPHTHTSRWAAAARAYLEAGQTFLGSCMQTGNPHCTSHVTCNPCLKRAWDASEEAHCNALYANMGAPVKGAQLNVHRRHAGELTRFALSSTVLTVPSVFGVCLRDLPNRPQCSPCSPCLQSSVFASCLHAGELDRFAIQGLDSQRKALEEQDGRYNAVLDKLEVCKCAHVCVCVFVCMWIAK